MLHNGTCSKCGQTRKMFRFRGGKWCSHCIQRTVECDEPSTMTPKTEAFIEYMYARPSRGKVIEYRGL